MISVGNPTRLRTGLRRAGHASLQNHSARMVCQQNTLHEEPEPEDEPPEPRHRFMAYSDPEQSSIGTHSLLPCTSHV